MKRILATAAMFAALATVATAAHAGGKTIGAVSTTFRMLGANDKVVVDRYDDPKVQNASCYVSYAKTGGVSGSLGIAEDPSRFSVACRATGPVKIVGNIDKSDDGEKVFSRSTSVLFKNMDVTRFYDAEKNVLIYLVTSTKLVNGSPFNSVSAIPVQ
jgi:CreA protein